MIETWGGGGPGPVMVGGGYPSTSLLPRVVQLVALREGAAFCRVPDFFGKHASVGARKNIPDPVM